MQTTPSSSRWHLETSEQLVILILGDFIASAIALLMALYIWAAGDAWLKFSIEFLRNRAPTWFYFLPIFWVLLMVGIYDLNKASNLRDTLKGIVVAVAISAMVYLVIYFAFPPNSLPRLGVALFLVFSAILTLLWRLIFVRIFKLVSTQKRVLIIGAGKAGAALVEVLSRQDPPPFTLIGLIDDDPGKLGTMIKGFPVLGNHTNIDQLIKDQGISDIVLAISNEMNHAMFQAILSAQESGVKLKTMSDTFETLTGRVPIGLLASDWVVRAFLDHSSTSSFYLVFKRFFDILGSLVGTIILVVLYPFIALPILIESGRPIIFRQERLGLGGKPYTLYKFRTMKRSADMIPDSLVTSVNDPRVTRTGKILRRTHIDELPQLINVLKGEMSLVGPRSERNELVIIFQSKIPFYRARMLVKPGITGWAQIHQAYAETSEETAVKLEYDLYYIQHANLLMDLTILLRTFGAVFGFKGR